MKDIYFYKYIVTRQVFYQSKFSYALVNLKPLVPGHVLVVPLRRDVERLGDLNDEESIDYMRTLQIVHKFIASIYKADSLNIAIQDGPESGQSVPHLHTHIIPRYKTDGYGDQVYSSLESIDLNQQYTDFFKRKDDFRTRGKFPVPEKRVPRTEEEMERESQWLREEITKAHGHG